MYSGGVSSRFTPGFSGAIKRKRKLTTTSPLIPKYSCKELKIPTGPRIQLNVSGKIFETYSHIFDSFPNTLLGMKSI